MSPVPALTSASLFQSTGAPASSSLLASAVFPAFASSKSVLPNAFTLIAGEAMSSDAPGGGQAQFGSCGPARHFRGARRTQRSFNFGLNDLGFRVRRGSQLAHASQPAAPRAGKRDATCWPRRAKPLWLAKASQSHFVLNVAGCDGNLELLSGQVERPTLSDTADLSGR